MSDSLTRTRMLLGAEGVERLRRSRVAVFGLGGVGGYAVEALARSGVGALDLVDSDVFSESNINRQLHALRSTVGHSKAETAAERVWDIDPDITLRAFSVFFSPDTAGMFDFSAYDYVVDAIDTVTGKLALIESACVAGTPVISSMGAGNKLDPTAFRVSDISETSFDPLARVMRKELRKRGIEHLKVVYSREPAAVLSEEDKLLAAAENPGRRDVPGSCAFVPAVVGLIMAGEVIKELSGINGSSTPTLCSQSK